MISLWEFHLQLDDGGLMGQTIIAEGANEAEALASANSLLDGQTGVTLSPCKVALPEVEARWREVIGDAFPAVVSDAGRFALYARGNK